MQPGATRLYLPAQDRRRNQAVSVGVWIYLFVYCAVAVCLALGLYDAVQPRRYQNPGQVPHQSAPAAEIAPEERFPISNQAAQSTATALAGANELEAETVGLGVPQPQAAQKSDRTASSKRTHVARRKTTHSPSQDYAAQSFFGSYPSRKTTNNSTHDYAARPSFSRYPPWH